MTFTTLVKSSCMSALLTILSLIGLSQPTANFSATPTSGCAPLVVNFTDLSTGNPTSWRWSLGNNTTSFVRNPSVTYFTPGTYTIKLVVQNAQGRDSLTRVQYITIHGKPTVDFSASAVTGCFPLNVQFTDLSSSASGAIDLWQWDFGDGNFSTSQNPSHVYTSAGTFNVSLRVRNASGCFQTVTRTQYIHIMDAPTASFTNSVSTSCTAPINIYFQNTSTGTGTLTYLWDFGDGFTSIMANPSHSFNMGTYVVKLTTTNQNGCSHTYTIPTPLSIGNAVTNFSIPDSVCANASFNITNLSTPNTASAFWDFGDGTTSTLASPTKSYSTPGAYIIKLVNNFGTCRDSIMKMIRVLPNPISAFTADVTASCLTPLTVTFTNTSTGASSYLWNFGDGNTSTQVNPSHTYTSAGLFTVTLTSTNAFGCSNSLVNTEYIKIEPPIASIVGLPMQGCAPFSWTFTSNNSSTEPVTSYLWDFGDGNTSTLPSPTHIFGIGVFDIKLVITTASGCTDSITVAGGIRAGDKPTANFSATPREACAELPVVFSDSSTGNNITQWFWDFGDGGTSSVQNPSHTYSDTGYFTVQLIVMNNGCPDTLIMEDYIHINPPIANFVVQSACSSRLSRIFTDRSIGADQYFWDFGDGNTSNLPNPVHTYATQGAYVVSLRVRNNASGCEYTKSANVRVIRETIDFTASQRVLCRSNSTTFTATALNNGNIATYSWNFGDNTGGNQRVVSKVYNLPGFYNVRLITTDLNGCRDTVIKPQYIRVNGPTANFSAANPGACLLSNVSFTDSSTTDGTNPIVRWIWSYGDGVIDTLTSGPFSHQYATAGIYTVKLTVTDITGCSHTVTKNNVITVSRPIANFSSLDTLTCPDRSVNFISTSTGPALTYSWFFGDGNVASVQNPVHNYLTNGNFSVKLVVVDQFGCTDSMIRANYISINTPVSNFSVSDSVGTCPPLVVDFVNSSQNYTSMLWDFGDGSTSTIVNPSHFYSIPGVYISSLKVTGPGGCISIKEQRITVRGPQGSFTYGGLSGCSPVTVNFVATTRDRISFIWDYNDGTTLTTSDSVVSHTYTIPGEYLPKMILRDAAGCLVPVRGIDTIRVNGINANFDFNGAAICNAGSIQFNNTTSTNDSIIGYQWTFGDNSTSTQESPSHYYATPGQYFPQLVVRSLEGCVDSIRSSIPVKIVANPVASISQTANGCAPVMVTYMGSAFADTSSLTWNWDFGNNNTANVKNPPAEQYLNAGVYNVRLLVTNSTGCRDTVLSTVEAYRIPVVNAGLDTMICQGRGKMLNATGALNYVWTPATGLSCTTCPNPIALPNTRTQYIVTGSTEHGCTHSDSIIVSIKYPFDMISGPGDTLCVGTSARLAASGAHSYEWSPATGLNNTTSASVNASPVITTRYRVIGRDDVGCFADTAYFPVVVYNIPTVDAGPDRVINVGQQIDLVPTISSDVIDARWSPTSGGFRNTFPSITVRPRETTTYTVVVNNQGGCTSSDVVTVSVICNGANIFIPNTFSPNGDGANDIFYPRGSGVFSIKSERVYSRWGELVFEKHNFQANDVSSAWNGTFKGQKLNPDVYVYVIEVLCDNNSLLTFKGNVTLIK